MVEIPIPHFLTFQLLEQRCLAAEPECWILGPPRLPSRVACPGSKDPPAVNIGAPFDLSSSVIFSASDCDVTALWLALY